MAMAKMEFRERKTKEKKPGQKAFDRLDAMFKPFDQNELKESNDNDYNDSNDSNDPFEGDFEVPIGALVYVVTPTNENQIKYPILIVENHNKIQPTAPHLRELIVSHIATSETLELWRINNEAPPILCDIPGSRLGGRGRIDESLVNIICENPRNSIYSAYRQITKLMEGRLLLMSNASLFVCFFFVQSFSVPLFLAIQMNLNK